VNKLRFVPDANTLINHLNGRLDVDAFFATQPEHETYLSVIAFMEVLSKPGMTPEEEQRTRAFLDQFIILEVPPEIRETTIKIRRYKKRIRLPDAIIAASAVELGAVLLSSDDVVKALKWPGLIIHDLL
jgi:predicted nucleic acid-binding protein